MRMRIDEAGGYQLAPGVDFFLANGGDLADRDDHPGLDGDVSLNRIAAATIDHGAAADDKVHHVQNPSLSAMP